MSDGSCPKCGTARDLARTHCAACGLAHDRMAAFARARDDVPAALVRAWDDAVAGWDDVRRHDELLRLATQHDAFAWAAARYRERVRARPDDAVGTERLDRVKRAAEATLLANAAARQRRAPEPYRNTMMLLGLMIIAIVAGLAYAIARGSGKPELPDRVPVPPGATK